jgi:hypothetical protein
MLEWVSLGFALAWAGAFTATAMLTVTTVPPELLVSSLYVAGVVALVVYLGGDVYLKWRAKA